MKFGNHLAAMASAALLAGVLVSCAGQAQTSAPSVANSIPTESACTRLAGVHLDQVAISSARVQTANAPVEGAAMPSATGAPGGGPQVSGLPAFCRVIGSIHPEAGSNIRFEAWLPSTGWNGRFAGGNNGGFAGSIGYMDLASAVRGGFAGGSTDTGHNTPDSTWAHGHPELIRDYGWRAVHLTTVAAKALVERYYGREADHSYFIGCSNGGRQALMEASRFPTDYDGIVAGAPAASLTDTVMSMINTIQAQAPQGAAIRPDQMAFLQSEVLRQCDGLDGQSDGLVADPRRCSFDASKLACGISNASQCFSQPQIEAVNRIHAGSRNASGQQAALGYPPSGAEAGAPIPSFGWDGWLAASPATPHQFFSGGMLRDFATPFFATPETFNFDTDPARLHAAVSADLDAQPNLRRFFDRGGKLIIWHGWADAAIPPQASVAFYETALRTSGPRAAESMRLFMAPGVQHCAGGTGADALGQIGAPQPSDTPERSIAAAVQAWVETGRAPDNIVARRGMVAMMAGAPSNAPERQRLLCAYPSEAVLQAGEDPDRAASYSCRAPASR